MDCLHNSPSVHHSRFLILAQAGICFSKAAQVTRLYEQFHQIKLKYLSSHRRLDEACATQGNSRKPMRDTGNICKHGLTFVVSFAFISETQAARSSHSIHGLCSVLTFPLSQTPFSISLVRLSQPNLFLSKEPTTLGDKAQKGLSLCQIKQ